MVPNSWDEFPLNQIAKVSIGLVTTMTENYRESGVPLIRNSDIFPNKVRTNKLIYLCDEFASKSEHRKFKSGDIVTVHTGDVGVSAVINTELAGSLGFATLNTRPNKELIDENYLCWFFNSERFINKCIALSTGDGRQNLNLKDFIKMKVSYPPLPEQRKIAQILSTWDRGIATTEKLIDASKQQKKALMQQLLTGKKRLIDPETGNVFKGDWEATTISQLITESRLTGTNGELAKKITVKLYGRGVTKKEEKRLGSESTKYYKRKAGQFIYSKLDFLNGAFGIIPQSLDGYESTLDLPAFDFTQNVIPKWFIEFVSRDDFYTSNLGLANGGRKARRVNPKDLLQIKVRLPSIKEQQKIASVLTAADKEIELLEAKLAHLKQEKKALMQQLLTGKRRVNIAETKVTTEEILEAEVA
ncbi:restriction endonuclease subunit S [Photobacterium damselae]|uniref:restriction endonuclease subunit S n=1 Tax=Photobacterium damselae TaxID=38293 RepID=UPI0040679EAB